MKSKQQLPNRRLLGLVLAAAFAIVLSGQWQSVNAQWATNGNNISNTNTGNVGVGTATPQATLDVRGSSSYGVSGIFSAIYAKGTADYPMALILDGAGTNDGIARMRALNNGTTKWQVNFADDVTFYSRTNDWLNT